MLLVVSSPPVHVSCHISTPLFAKIQLKYQKPSPPAETERPVDQLDAPPPRPKLETGCLKAEVVDRHDNRFQRIGLSRPTIDREGETCNPEKIIITNQKNALALLRFGLNSVHTDRTFYERPWPIPCRVESSMVLAESRTS